MARHTQKPTNDIERKHSIPSRHNGITRKGITPIFVQGALWIVASAAGCLISSKMNLAFNILFAILPKRLNSREGTVLVFAMLLFFAVIPGLFPRTARPYLLLPAVLVAPGAFLFLFLTFNGYMTIPQTTFTILMFTVLIAVSVVTTIYRVASISNTTAASRTETGRHARHEEGH